MKEKLRIFISSPIKGLEEERKTLIEALEKEYTPEAMELWVSSPEHPKNVCLERVRNSDALIVLTGPYYGSVDPLIGKSFTELEYDEADAYGIDIFHFYKVKDTGRNFESDEISEEIKQKHQSFFKKIWQFRGQGFVTPSDAVGQVLAALKEYSSKKHERLRPLVEADEYFKDFLRRGYFRHDYKLVGRIAILESLKKFVESDDKRVFVLLGRGGLGKSKILYEFAKNINQYGSSKWKQVLFLREIFDINQTVLQDLPVHPCLIVLDDAHRYEDLDTLLSIFKGNPAADKIKLIISARPLGREKINYSISRNIPYENLETYELEGLSDNEVKQLTTNLLSDKNPAVISIISEMTKDCPLATIVACNLINDGHINPNTLPGKEEFQRIIFDRFLEEFKGKNFSDLQTQRLLEYISALSPMVPSDNEFRKSMSEILNIPISEIARRVSALEERGLLLRKGRLVKIVPDLLSDYILYQACIDKQNVSTNFATEIIEAFHEIYLKNILFNISEIEWRAKISSKPIDLLGDVWKEIKEDFRKSPIYGRMKILDEIEKAAIFQPQHVLEIIDIVIKEPSTAKIPEDNILSSLEWSNDSVLEKLPKVLRRIAYNIEYFEKSCDILWDLGKKETRELNPYPESPIRILLDLAEYGIRKPKAYNVKMLGCIKKWLQQDDAYSYRYSPLDILVKLLAKEGEDMEFRAGGISMRGFPLNFDAVNDLRKEALIILQQHLDPQKPKHIISRSLDLLIDSLRYPLGVFGRQPSEEEYKYLEKEQKSILNIIKEAIPILNSEALNTIIKKDLRWYQLHGRTDEIKSVVQDLIDSIEETDIFRIYRVVIGNFREFLEHDHNWEKHNQIIDKEVKEVTRIILNNYPSGQDIFNLINSIINDVLQFKLSVNPNHILSQIAKDSPDIGIELFKLIIDNPDAELSRFLSALIWPLKLNEKYCEVMDALIRKAIVNKDYWPCLNIAHSFSYGVDEYRESDYINIKELLKFNQEDITKALVHGLAKIGQKDAAMAYEMSLLIDFNKIPGIVEDFCSIFDDKYGASLGKLTEDQIELILKKLLRINIFKGQHWHTDQFLKNIADTYPGLIVSFFVKRLAYAREEDMRSRDYAPLPYLDLDHDFFKIEQIKDADKYIRVIRDLALSPEEMDTFWLPRLFKIVSNNFLEESLNVLKEWFRLKEKQKLEAISLLLREADQGFLFARYEFIGELIYEAANISSDCLKNVKSSLFGIAVSGGSTRSHGQPSQKNIQLRDKGEEIAKKFQPGHPAEQFYKEVSEYGSVQIKEELERDQELEYE